MPRKLRVPKPRLEPLDPAVAAILLGGWLANPPGGRVRHGFAPGELELFSGGDAAFTRLWQQHDAALRQLACEWHVEPQWAGPNGTAMYFAEALAAGVADPDYLGPDDLDADD